MSYGVRKSVTIDVDASGDATAYSEAVNGRIISVTYVKDDYANGVDFTITTETTLQNVWVDTNINASEVVYPRAATNGTDGAASLYAAAGTAVQDYIWAIDERIKFVIAAGGVSTGGTFHVVVG